MSYLSLIKIVRTVAVVMVLLTATTLPAYSDPNSACTTGGCRMDNGKPLKGSKHKNDSASEWYNAARDAHQ